MSSLKITGNIFQFAVLFTCITLAPVGYWFTGVTELDGGFMGLLFLYMFGLPLTYNKMPLSLACAFPEAVVWITWFVGVGLFFYYC